jgi:hypothetical protein
LKKKKTSLYIQVNTAIQYLALGGQGLNVLDYIAEHEVKCEAFINRVMHFWFQKKAVILTYKVIIHWSKMTRKIVLIFYDINRLL